MPLHVMLLKVIRLAVLMLMLTSVFAEARAAGVPVQATVLEVRQGDHLTVLLNNVPTEVMLHGITCPDIDDSIGAEAQRYTSAECLGRRVEMEIMERVDAGLIVRLRIAANRVLNDELVARGLAQLDSPAAPVAPQSTGEKTGTYATEKGASSSSDWAPREKVLLAAVVILLLSQVLVFLRRRGGTVSSSRLPGASSSKDLRKATLRQEYDLAALAESKAAIRALLRNVKESLAGMLDQNESYTSNLARHRASIERTSTLASLEVVERVLIAELEQMQNANTAYQKKLDLANTRLAEQESKLEQVQLEARKDHLTGVPNRRALDERLKEEFDRAERSRRPFSVLLLDIDHFKRFNDTYGHQVGDHVLNTTAATLSAQLRKVDMIARYGGEEFAAVLPDTDLVNAQLVAEKLRAAVELASVLHKGQALKVTVSIGVASSCVEKETLRALLERADKSLYRAKEAGRNRVEISTAITPDSPAHSSDAALSQ